MLQTMASMDSSSPLFVPWQLLLKLLGGVVFMPYLLLTVIALLLYPSIPDQVCLKSYSSGPNYLVSACGGMLYQSGL